MAATVYSKQIRRHTLSEVIPVESFDEESKLFTLADGFISFGFITKPLSGSDESISQRLNVLLGFDYPNNSFIQIMLFGSQDINPVLQDIKSLRTTRDQALIESLEKRIEMLIDSSTKPISSHAQSFVRQFKLFFSVKLPLKNRNILPKQEEINFARDLRVSFEQTLKSVGFTPEPMNAEDYLRLMGQLLHWGPKANWRSNRHFYDPETPINEQVSECDDLIVTDHNGIWLGQKRLRILSPGRLPEQMDLSNMRRMFGDPLTGARGLHGNFFINLNIFIPENNLEKQTAAKERTVINYQTFGPLLKFNPQLLQKKESADLLFKSVTEGDRILKIMLCVGLFANTLEESETRLAEATTYFSEIGWTMREDKYITFPMLINSLPMCADAEAVNFLQRYKRCGSKHAVEFMPIISDWSGTGTPQLNFISRSGQIMGVDLFNSNTNYNTCIVAASGSGKSFLTNDIITSYTSSGSQCWVIDIGRSYEKLTKAIKGDFVEFGENSNICLNPFQIIKNYMEEADMLIGIIVSMAAMEDKLTDLQLARLRSVVKDLWDKHGSNLDVDKVAGQLLKDDDTRVMDMGHQLFAFTSEGEYGRFFNGQNNVSFNNSLTCLELEELNGRSHLQQVVLLILIYQIQQSMYLGDRNQRKVLILDEAWDLLSKGNIAKFIETGYRRFRKYNGLAITITQSLNDLYNSPSGVAIAENSANLFLLYQKPETIESIKRQNRLMIGEGGFAFLKSVHTVTGQYSEIFFITSYGMGIGRLMVDKYTKLLYSTHPDDIKKISQRTSKGLSTAEAINDILNNDL